MLRTAQLVFDDVVQGTSTIYTDPTWNEPMGVADVVSIGYIASQVSGTSVTLTIAVETSPDNVNWFTPGGTPPVDAVSIPANTKTAAGAGYFNNGSRYTRLAITLGGTTPNARLQVWWNGRDFALPSA
jgi:hypothetical protein